MCRHNNTYNDFMFIYYLICDGYGLASSTTLKMAAGPASATGSGRRRRGFASAAGSGGFTSVTGTGLTLTGLRHYI